MAGGDTYSYLPDGSSGPLPMAPRTWVDPAPGVRGDPLRATDLELSAGAGTMWHRQRPLFQGIATLAQSIPTSTWTAISGLSELIDNYAGHSDTSNTGRWYAPLTSTAPQGRAGDWYLASGYVPFSSTDAAHVHIAGLRVTGGTVLEGTKLPAGTGHNVDCPVIDLVQMHDQDYLELMAYQTTGAAVNTVVSGKTPSLTVRWVCQDPANANSFTPALPGVPHTWADSDVFTGSATGAGKVPLNTEIRDLIRFLNHPPIARLTSQGTTQTIPSNASAYTSIAFPTESVDNYGGHDNATNNSRYTCQRAGLYLVAGYASVAEAGTNSGYRSVRLLVNGTTPYGGMITIPMTSGTTGTAIYATALLRLNAGDYVETQMQHNQGTALTVNSAAGNASKMIVVWMAK